MIYCRNVCKSEINKITLQTKVGKMKSYISTFLTNIWKYSKPNFNKVYDFILCNKIVCIWILLFQNLHPNIAIFHKLWPKNWEENAIQNLQGLCFCTVLVFGFIDCASTLILLNICFLWCLRHIKINSFQNWLFIINLTWWWFQFIICLFHFIN